MTVDDKRADWLWYYSTDQEIWTEAGRREEAIEQGAECVEPGGTFLIAQCISKGPWPTLFGDAGDLCDFIDDQNEDNAFEEGFTAEAGLSSADLAPLTTAINALWVTFLEQHKPRSRGLISGPSETITTSAPDAPPLHPAQIKGESR